MSISYLAEIIRLTGDDADDDHNGEDCIKTSIIGETDKNTNQIDGY